MIARLRDRWDGTFFVEGDDLLEVAKAVYGEDRSYRVRYASDPSMVEKAVIVENAGHGELVLAYVLATEEYR